MARPTAYCPLCGYGSSNPYDRGFTHPEGLHRHLSGHGAYPCAVLDQVAKLARWSGRTQFEKHAEAIRAAAETAKAERRTREAQFRIDSDGAPLLRDDDLSYGENARDDAGLQWVDARLAGLGFERIENDRTITYVFRRERYVVFADPRRAKRIEFRVSPARPGVASKRREPALVPGVGFTISDRLKHGVAAKFTAQLSDSVAALEDQLKRRRR